MLLVAIIKAIAKLYSESLVSQESEIAEIRLKAKEKKALGSVAKHSPDEILTQLASSP